MNMIRRTTLTLLILLIASSAMGSGFAIWEMGIKSSAMGGAFVATADDPSAIFYNPAGLTNLQGINVSLYVTTIVPRTEFSGVDPNPGYGVTERLDDPFFVLPQFYGSYAYNEDLVFGLGFCTPYGLAVEWENPETFTGRGIATLTDLKTFFFTPSVAVRVNDRFRFGAGFNIVGSIVELNRYKIAEVNGNATEIAEVHIEGWGKSALGFNFGMLLQITDRTTFGLNYKSDIDLEFEGDAHFTDLGGVPGISLVDQSVETALTLPEMAVLGVASQVTEKLLVEFDFCWIKWSSFDELLIIFPEDTELNEAIPEEYENSRQYRFGVEYQYNPELALRAGFVYDESPQPLAGTGPVLPDSDRTGYSIGAGYDFGNFDVEFYNLFLTFKDREVRDSFSDYNGDYRTYTNLAGVGINYRF
jgi:long-chain fatty acid transport protein